MNKPIFPNVEKFLRCVEENNIHYACFGSHGEDDGLRGGIIINEAVLDYLRDVVAGKDIVKHPSHKKIQTYLKKRNLSLEELFGLIDRDNEKAQKAEIASFAVPWGVNI